MEKTQGQILFDTLTYEKKNIYASASPELMKDIFSYADGYRAFLNEAKTERESVKAVVAMAKENGFSEYHLGEKLSVGDLRYWNVYGKCVILFKIGKNDLEKDGVRILAAHIDNPRLDLKPMPLYEDSQMSFLKTHYYGGIKKYQWTTIPLSLHGVMVKKDGTTVDVKIGEDQSDPVFYINDLLPHLGQKQAEEPLGKAIPAENLNILFGGIPYADDNVKDAIKLNVLAILNEKYGVTENDFLSAELSLVPAFAARDVGLDRAFIGAYGHDDRVCSFPAVTALFAVKDTKHTVMAFLADKEEIGSIGVSGMQSDLLVDLLTEIALSQNKNPRLVKTASKCLSADVTAAFDPNFSEAYEKMNSALISCGTAISKYNGARGKSGSSDASAEYVGFVRKLFEDKGVTYQMAELGKVDLGGGGTVANYIANHSIETLDIGVPVISMHAPYEVISKADLYATYLAFRAFIE